MSKFTKSERELLKSWVASRSLLRMSDKEIITSIKEETDFEISQATLTRIKRSLKIDAAKWYNSLLNGRSDFLAKIKESWDSLILLQKTTWEEFRKCEGNPIMRNKFLNLNLRISEDIIGVLDSLRYIGVVYPVEDKNKPTLQQPRNTYSQRSFEVDERPTFNKTF